MTPAGFESRNWMASSIFRSRSPAWTVSPSTEANNSVNGTRPLERPKSDHTDHDPEDQGRNCPECVKSNGLSHTLPKKRFPFS